jgi:hypothetical protein
MLSIVILVLRYASMQSTCFDLCACLCMFALPLEIFGTLFLRVHSGVYVSLVLSRGTVPHLLSWNLFFTFTLLDSLSPWTRLSHYNHVLLFP